MRVYLVYFPGGVLGVFAKYHAPFASYKVLTSMTDEVQAICRKMEAGRLAPAMQSVN